MGAASGLLAGCGGPQATISVPGISSDSGDALTHHKTFYYTG